MKFDAYNGYRKSRGRFLPTVFLILIVSVIAVVVSSYVWYSGQLQPVSDDATQQIVTVPVGATVQDVALLLEERELIRSATAFGIYSRFDSSRSNLQAGGYKLSPSMSTQEILDALTTGDVASDLVTILPGQRLDQILSSLINDAGYSEEVATIALQDENYSDHPALQYKPANATLEGYLYPESYQRQVGEPVENVITQALDQTAKIFDSKTLAGIEQQGLTPHEAIILASIVDKEVSIVEDKPVVAQVFLKRYNTGMMLGSDATSLYGAEVAGMELAIFADTPYNTRIYEGLPPGPISNVTNSALQAVAYPAQTDYLYFVSGDDGFTYFSNTLAEHEAATAEHCIELCKLF